MGAALLAAPILLHEGIASRLDPEHRLRISPLSVVAAVFLAGARREQAPGRVQYQANTPRGGQVVLVAHQDDWQLFMGDVIADRIRAGGSVTFIYVTAGDDGRDSSYWTTRERAALQSTRVASGNPSAERGSIQCSLVWVVEHSVRRCVVGKTESYFLRLPDGKRNGAGFAGHNYQSLRKLRAGTISSIMAVDESATYSGWQDLLHTVSALISRETTSGGTTLHATDPSKAINPHDHFDHRMVGLIAYDLRKSKPLNTRFYVGYAVATRAANRTSEQARAKKMLFLAYDNEMIRANKTWSAFAEHPAFYSQCMVRTYARTAQTAGSR
jgi:LmbE family N-acetylglucosaminyl deacetylase